MISSEHKKKQRLPWRVVLLPVVLAVLGVVAYMIFQFVRTELNARAAEQLLEQYDHTGRRMFLSQARERLQLCLASNPKDGRLHFLAARAARRGNDSDAAANHLRRAEKLGWVKEAIEFEQVLSDVQRGELGRHEGPLTALVQQGHSDRLLVLEALVQGYFKTYQLLQALHCLDLWIEAEPNQSHALLQRGEIHLLLMRNREAKEDYLRGLELDPEDDAARQKLADLLISDQQAAQALPHFEELLRRRPGDPPALLGLARCKTALNDAAAAATLLDKLLADHPHHATALAERGRLALDAGHHQEAERLLREAVARDRFQSEAVFSLYRCLEANGKKEEAAKWFKRSEAIKADRKKLDEVKAELLKSSKNASLRSEMGRILLRNGQETGGLQWLRSALTIEPRHPPTLEALKEHQGILRDRAVLTVRIWSVAAQGPFQQSIVAGPMPTLLGAAEAVITAEHQQEVWSGQRP